MTRDELVKLITDALDAARQDSPDLVYGQFEEDDKQVVGVTAPDGSEFFIEVQDA